jgi:hypothetical protein
MSTQYRIRPILRRAGRLEEAAVRAQLRILRDARRAILARMVDAGAFDRFRLTLLLQAIDIEIMQGTAAAQRAIAGATEQAFGLGRLFSTVALGTPQGLIGVSGELLRAVVFVTTDQIRDVWGELGSRLKLIIRRAALGVTDPFEAMKALARVIRDPKTFGRAFWRAEAIVRTEVGRAFEIASQAEKERAAKAGVKVGKYWLHSGRTVHPRPEHIAAGETYSLKAPILWNRPFVIAGENLMYPKDPSASAANTINCGCTSVPVVLES